MRSIHFNAPFHFFSMGVALAVGLAGGIVLEQVRPRAAPQVVDTSSYRVIGVGCGTGSDYAKLFLAVEEDNLPGPRCDVVQNYDPIEAGHTRRAG